MNRFLSLLVLVFFANQLFSQALGYNKHRIAISADGNNQPDNHEEAKWPRADPDDWGGTPATLAMIAKADLKDRLVHFSYNNFIEAPKHTTETNYMADGVNGAIERWGFDDSVFFDVPENPTLAIAHLAAELQKSSETDPLYFIHMGPSEFFYQAVKKVVDAGKANALAHVYVISHSGYNDNHLRRLAHHTMEQTIALSENKIQYQKIIDQNACEQPDKGWCSGTNFEPFYWMRDHADPNIQWLYSRLQFHPGNKGADISDAGMLWYLLKNDEQGNMAKLKAFIGNGIGQENTTPVTGVKLNRSEVKVYLGRKLSLEAEVLPQEASDKTLRWTSANSEIASVSATGQITAKSVGQTQLTVTTSDGGYTATATVKVVDFPTCTDFTYVGIKDFEMAEVDDFVIAYKDNGRNAVAVNAGLYKDKFAATQKVFDGANGFYNITLTTLLEEDGESTYRLRVNGQLVGEFQNPETAEDMVVYTHTFKNVLVETGDMLQIESNTHSNGKIPEGDAFAFARGRWRSLAFQCANECVVEDVDGMVVFEAERFKLNGQWKLGKDEEKASGGEYIYYDGPNAYQQVNLAHKISHTFRINEAGNYTFKWTMRQPEGERGSDLGNDAWFYFDGDIAKGGENILNDYRKFVGRSTDDFVLNGSVDYNHKQAWVIVSFPEPGEYTLNLCGRSHGFQVDRIILYKGMKLDAAELKIKTLSETTSCGLTDPVSLSEAIKFKNLPVAFSNKQTEIRINLTYVAVEARDALLSIMKPDGTTVQTQTQKVETGFGETEITFQLDAPLTADEGYMLKAELRTVGGTANDTLATNVASFKVVDGQAPAAEDKVAFIDPPSEVSDKALEIPVRATYWATQERDLNVELKTADNQYVINKKITVPAGSKDTVVTLVLPEALIKETAYKFILSIRPAGGSWQENIHIETANFVAVGDKEEPVATIALTDKTAAVDVAATVVLTATTTPADASVVWSSANELIATVDSDGVVTGVAAGETTIKAELASGQWDECLVTVTALQLVTSVELSSTVDLKVFPNPSDNVFNFKNNGQISLVDVCDMNGKNLLTQDVQQGMNAIRLTQQKKGIYLLKFTLADASQKIIRVVKQ